MIARPAVTTLACHGCRNAVYRAVLASSAPSFRSFAQSSVRPAPMQRRRLFSSERQVGMETAADNEALTTPKGTEEATDVLNEDLEESGDKPWFLDEAPPRHPSSQHIANLPKSPEGAPELLEPMIKYVYEDMGLDDIGMLDLREMDPHAALGPNLIMLFATARSERHLHISAGRFVRWLKRNYKINATADGLIGAGELKTKLRRLRKKAKLMGTNATILPGGDNGISTGWVCVNFGTNDGSVPEAERFDEEGRFSGFGTPQNSTTIVVQCLTEARREELDLESLWQGLLKRSMQQGKKIRGESTADKAEIDAMVAARVQLAKPTTEAGLQWEALKLASQQRRGFSTTARRLQPLDSAVPTPSSATEQECTGEVALPDLSAVQQQIRSLQLRGSPLNSGQLPNMIAEIFHATAASEDSPSERLALVDQLLLMASERDLPVLSVDMLVTLIESIATSSDYGPKLQQAQRNLELVLAETHKPLNDDQFARLLGLYAFRSDWTRFWNIWRTPARFEKARTPEQYELVYRALTSTLDSKLCTDALRWVYPEMLKEEPPVIPSGQLYASLKACILVADPAAEEMLMRPPPTEEMGVIEQRKGSRREFMRVLKEVEELRKHALEGQVREQRSSVLDRMSEAT